VTITKDDTTIVHGAGKKAGIEGRIAQIKQQIEDTTSDYDKEKLQERLAKLAGGAISCRALAIRPPGSSRNLSALSSRAGVNRPPFSAL
jgi:hypothetical protein